MLYSEDIPKICSFCIFADKIDEDNIKCQKNNKTKGFDTAACRHYKYDIFKRTVRRRKPLKTDEFKPEDFELL